MEVKLKSQQPIDIILPTHGNLKLTMECVDALYANTQTPFHLVVVDDSTPDMDEGVDLTPSWFCRFKATHPNLTFIHSNTPYKSGNQFLNVALAHCQNPFVATVGNSIHVEPDWELMALHVLKKDPKVGIVGIKCLYSDGSIESVGITFRGHIPLDIGRGLPGYRLSWGHETLAVQWACAILRKEAIGTLDENLYNGFVGWDDIDNCLMLRKNGWKVMATGQGVVFHNPRATRGSNTEEVTMKNHQNAEVFYKRWGFWKGYRQANGKEPEYFKHMKAEEMPEFVQRFVQPLPNRGSLSAQRKAQRG